MLAKRRKFFRYCLTAASAVILGPGRILSGRAAEGRLRGLSTARFGPMLGARFHLAASNSAARVQVRLVEVDESTVSPEVDQFSLVFRGRRNVRLPGGIYQAASEDGDSTFDVYMEPMDTDRRDREYYLAHFAILR